MANKYIESSSSSFVNMEMQIKATGRYPASWRQNLKVWKCQNLKVGKGNDVGKEIAPIHCCRGMNCFKFSGEQFGNT